MPLGMEEVMVTSLQKQIDKVRKRVENLEKWQIKVALILAGLQVIIIAIVIWLVNWGLDKMAERILNGG